MSKSNTVSFPQPICEQIWEQKYKFVTDREGYTSDVVVEDTWRRIAKACAKGNISLEHQFYEVLEDFKFLPAGRIQSGVGTGRNVTLFNCFVMGTIPDSLSSIFDMLKEAALTMQQGGGIGYDFSTLRPKNAPVKGVESFSSGPLTFMDVWDAMCKTIMSAGHRRGAMMATMRCDHPDIEDFITAKQDPLRLRKFNVSVLVTDKFMEFVKENKDWDLIFDGKVYKTVKAKYLWDLIIQNTYDYAEPGVIFIDRINQMNNLWFTEYIAATNPCGEQPLPPYGACLLGSINLVKFVQEPFTEYAEFDYQAFGTAVRSATMMLDSIIGISGFPLEKQEQEAKHKRRMGLGFTGLADALFMLGIPYNSFFAEEFTSLISEELSVEAYKTSIDMAKLHGPAPIVVHDADKESFIASEFIQKLPKEIHKGIQKYGIRNSHLTSIAPTGTISMLAGNVSSGIEPIFAVSYDRKITNQDGTKRTETVYSYSVDEYNKVLEAAKAKDDCDYVQYLTKWWDKNMVTAQTLEPNDHLVIQAAAQNWIDSSISKTINCPENISFEDFQNVYEQAYELGNKGCTTYRPNDVTGSVLSVTEEPKEEAVEVVEEIPDTHVATIKERPEALEGATYKLRWDGDAIYMTINHDIEDGKVIPFEIFVNSKNLEHQAAIAALTRMISAIFRRGGDVSFVAEELQNVYDPRGGNWIDGKYYPSLFAVLGNTLEKHMITDEVVPTAEPVETTNPPAQCPSCKEFSLITMSGCPTCTSCGYSKCG